MSTNTNHQNSSTSTAVVAHLTSAFDTVGLLMMRGLALAQLAKASRCTRPILSEPRGPTDRTYQTNFTSNHAVRETEGRKVITRGNKRSTVSIPMVPKPDDTDDS